MGGKHFVYVFGNSIETNFYKGTSGFAWETALEGKPASPGRYDNGQRLMDIFRNYFTPDLFTKIVNGVNLAPINAIEREIMWVSIPLPAPGFEFKHPDQMSSDVRFQINVAKPYRYGFSGMATVDKPNYNALNKVVSVNHPTLLPSHVRVEPKNNNFPLYSFNTSDIATLFSQDEIAKNALDLIRVVPNPYYGSSTYESRRTDNFVRITNLPNKCTVRIYTMNGTLVRTIKRDVSGQEELYTGVAGGGDDIKRSKRIPYTEWDLKNQNNISVASGLYIFHIDAGDVGEKIVKWFGVMRPLDVQNY